MLFKNKRRDIKKKEIILNKIYCNKKIDELISTSNKPENDGVFKIKPDVHFKPYTNERNDMAVLTCLFNPSQSVRVLQNYLTVAHQFKLSNIPFYTIELSSNNTYFTQKSLYHFHVKSNSYMFHKENLLNVLAKKIPKRFSKFCFLDADIIFSDTEWYDKVSTLLDEYNIVQPFEQCARLDISYKQSENFIHSCCTSGKQGGHPGFVFCLRRNFFESIDGFCDSIITGGGDSVFAQSFLNDNEAIKRWVNFSESPFEQSIIHLNERVKLAIENSNLKTATFLKDCTVYHLFHGVLVKRDYGGRINKFKMFVNKMCPGFDYIQLLKKNEDGVYEFKDQYREESNKFFLIFFRNRDDDGI